MSIRLEYRTCVRSSHESPASQVPRACDRRAAVVALLNRVLPTAPAVLVAITARDVQRAFGPVTRVIQGAALPDWTDLFAWPVPRDITSSRASTWIRHLNHIEEQVTNPTTPRDSIHSLAGGREDAPPRGAEPTASATERPASLRLSTPGERSRSAPGNLRAACSRPMAERIMLSTGSQPSPGRPGPSPTPCLLVLPL